MPEINVHIPAPDPGPGPRQASPAAFSGLVAGANRRMREDYPEAEFWVIKINHARRRMATTPPGPATGSDNTFDVSDGARTMRHVPAPFDSRAWRYLLEGMTVVVRYWDVSRQKPYIAGVGSMHRGTRRRLSWLAWAFNALRIHAQEDAAILAAEGTDLNLDFPVHFRSLNSVAYVFREDTTSGGLERFVADSSGKKAAVEKVWHDMLITAELDGIVGLESGANAATIGGHPTDGRFASGQVCVMCREVSDLKLRWQTCLGTFGVEIDDGGIGVG